MNNISIIQYEYIKSHFLTMRNFLWSRRVNHELYEFQRISAFVQIASGGHPGFVLAS